jgi:hypothetical protein
MNTVSRFFVLMSALLLSACAHPTVLTHVTRFHRLPHSIEDRTFEIASPSKAGELEAEIYENKIAGHLREYGWRRTTARSADYLVSYEYESAGPREIHGVAPVYGQVGFGPVLGFGTVHTVGRGGRRYGTVTSTYYVPPSYGVVGSVPVSHTVYDRRLLISARGKNGAEIFQLRCQSTGGIPEISRVLPAMIDAAFEDFPGESGKTVHLRQEIED